jgi:hypothetical protein
MNQLLFLSLFFLSATPAAIADDCSSDFQRRIFPFGPGKKEIPITAHMRDGVVDFRRFYGNDAEVAFGIAYDGHYYLTVGHPDQPGYLRIDGAFLPLPVFKTTGKISNGYLIKFPGVPPEKAAAFVEKMREKGNFRGFSVSCVGKACSALRRDFGIRVAGTVGPRVFSGTTFKKILENGFVDREGKPVPIEIYMTSTKAAEPNKMHTELASQDFNIGLVSMIGFGILGGGAGTFYLLTGK